MSGPYSPDKLRVPKVSVSFIGLLGALFTLSPIPRGQTAACSSTMRESRDTLFVHTTQVLVHVGETPLQDF